MGILGLFQKEERTFEEKQPSFLLIPDVSYVAGTFVLVLVADYLGRIIGEVQPKLGGISWRLNNYGEVKMQWPNGGDLRPELIQLGNRVLLQFDNGLPAWSGVMDLPRKWAYGGVETSAYSGELLFNWRLTAKARSFVNATGGQIYQTLIREMAEPLVVEPGIIWLEGERFSAEYHWHTLYSIFADGRLTGDFDVEGLAEGGRIRFRANFYPRKGQDKPQVKLLEGHNLSELGLEETGEIINQWLLAGAGNDWTDNGRAYTQAEDLESARKYALRQRSAIESDVTDEGTLLLHGLLRLEASSEPYPVVSGNAINLAPAAFGSYGLGDRVGVELYSFLPYGFNGLVRIVGREFLPQEGVSSLVMVI